MKDRYFSIVENRPGWGKEMWKDLLWVEFSNAWDQRQHFGEDVSKWKRLERLRNTIRELEEGEHGGS